MTDNQIEAMVTLAATTWEEALPLILTYLRSGSDYDRAATALCSMYEAAGYGQRTCTTPIMDYYLESPTSARAEKKLKQAARAADKRNGRAVRALIARAQNGIEPA